MIAHFNRSADNLEALKAETKGDLVPVQADLRDERAAERLFGSRKCQILIGKSFRLARLITDLQSFSQSCRIRGQTQSDPRHVFGSMGAHSHKQLDKLLLGHSSFPPTTGSALSGGEGEGCDRPHWEHGRQIRRGWSVLIQSCRYANAD